MLRFFIAFILATLVSVLLFSWMYHLLKHDDFSIQSENLYSVDISQIKTDDFKKTIDKKNDAEEPAMEPLVLENPVLPDVISDIHIDIPDVQMPQESNDLIFEQQYWAQPAYGSMVGVDGVGQDGFGKGGKGKDDGLDYIGERNEGKKEMVPSSSRRPNIPLIAYENRIDGWVLLAFTVEPNGEVKNIRVMDAYPRGIFESNAIIAISTWRYDPFKGPAVNLAQRIEFEWNMYSYNMEFK